MIVSGVDLPVFEQLREGVVNALEVGLDPLGVPRAPDRAIVGILERRRRPVPRVALLRVVTEFPEELHELGVVGHGRVESLALDVGITQVDVRSVVIVRLIDVRGDVIRILHDVIDIRVVVTDAARGSPRRPPGHRRGEVCGAIWMEVDSTWIDAEYRDPWSQPSEIPSKKSTEMQ